ncbi:MAG: mannonate dehydratase [Rhodobacterales bacterium]|nr:mannonate dehydratase [Rhodobacterales bacterium]
MYIGEQIINPSDDRLRLSCQLGVENVVLDTRPNTRLERDDGTWDAGKVAAFRRWVEGFGLKLECLSLDMGSFLVDAIHAPERADARAAKLRADIRAAADGGLPMLKYNVQMVGITRTGQSRGRGGVLQSSFVCDDYSPDKDAEHSYWGVGHPGLNRNTAGEARKDDLLGQALATEITGMSADQVWSALARLVETIVPVAEQAGIRLACHPHDPAYPQGGLNGVEHVMASIEGIERYLDMAPESPVHGMNFCQGTIAEMSPDPASYVLEAIKRIGGRQRIFMVHFRNIKGGYLNFSECFPDEGSVDMVQAIRAYRDVGYGGILCPDHVPSSDLDPDRERFFAFALGYTRGLLQAA